MATISNFPVLTQSTTGSKTTINVAYTATFTPYERKLTTIGVTYTAFIDVYGVAGVSEVDTQKLITSFPSEQLAVTNGTTNQSISRTKSMEVPRSLLQEDAGADSDEIQVKVRIKPTNWPTEVEKPSNVDVLLG